MSPPHHDCPRFDPDVGEIDAGVEDDDGVLDRGFDLSEVCVCFQVRYRRPVVGLTRLRQGLNQGGGLRATSRTARFLLYDGNGPGTRGGGGVYLQHARAPATAIAMFGLVVVAAILMVVTLQLWQAVSRQTEFRSFAKRHSPHRPNQGSPRRDRSAPAGPHRRVPTKTVSMAARGLM